MEALRFLCRCSRVFRVHGNAHFSSRLFVAWLLYKASRPLAALTDVLHLLLRCCAFCSGRSLATCFKAKVLGAASPETAVWQSQAAVVQDLFVHALPFQQDLFERLRECASGLDGSSQFSACLQYLYRP